MLRRIFAMSVLLGFALLTSAFSWTEQSQMVEAQVLPEPASFVLSSTDLSSLVEALKGVNAYLRLQPKTLTLPGLPPAITAPAPKEALVQFQSLVTKQSEADTSSLSRAFSSLKDNGSFSNPVISGGSISGTSGSFSSLSAGNLSIGADGRVGIGTTTPQALLGLNDPAGVDPFLVGSSTPKLVIKDSGLVGMGTFAPLGLFHVNMTAYSYGEAPTPETAPPASGIVPPNGGIVLTSNTHGSPITGVAASNVSVGTGLYLRSVRARGTLASPLAVQAGDILLDMASDAWDGDSRVGDIASITFLAEGTIADGRVPTGINFITSTDAAPSVTAERMRISAAGNVGIGTTSPSSRLQVFSSAASSAFSALVPGGAEIAAIDNSSAVFLGVGASDVAAVPGVYVRGVRARNTVASPTAVVADDIISIFAGEGYDGSSRVPTAQMNIEVDGTPGSSDMPGRITFLTTPDGSASSLERMRITNAGRVGIGITNPQQTLTVASSVGLQGIGTGAGTAYICTTLATGILSTSTSACNPSSLRFKDNIENLNPALGLEAIRQLRPVSYTYKPELLIPGDQIGFIAEEVAPIIPQVVGLDASSTPANIDYAKLAPVLVKAIQELDTKVNGTSTQTVTDNSGIIDTLSFAGMQLFQNSMRFVEIIADKITTVQLNTKRIQMTDEDTGQEYCLKMKSSTLISTPGECTDAPATPPPVAPDPAPEEEPTP